VASAAETQHAERDGVAVLIVTLFPSSLLPIDDATEDEMSDARGSISSQSKAAMGLALIREAILDHLARSKDGLRNADIARELGLESDHEGHQKDYLTYSGLGLLLKQHEVDKVRRGSRVYYVRRGVK